MNTFVKKVSAKGIHGRFDIYQEFNGSVNILFGRNGTGKTTLLHILANVLNGDYKRFAYLVFQQISVHLSDGTQIGIERRTKNNSIEIEVNINDKRVEAYTLVRIRTAGGRNTYRLKERNSNKKSMGPPLQTAYFPAFRSVIEAGSSAMVRHIEQQRLGLYYHLRMPWNEQTDERVTATEIARLLFGLFVPSVSYPSPAEIEQRLVEEATQALIVIGQADQRVLSEALVDLFHKILEDPSPLDDPTDSPEDILAKIRELSEELKNSPFDSEANDNHDYSSSLIRLVHDASGRGKGNIEQAAVRMLNTYRQSLAKRVDEQRQAYENIHRYLSSVNQFLESKKLILHRDISQSGSTSSEIEVQISHEDQTTTGMQVLSSGERQIVTLLYAVTHMSSQEVVLVDEPEISLHIDWQRLLLRKMAEQLGDRQLIVCTHSPIIGADYEDYLTELNLVQTRIPLQSKEIDIDEDWFDADEIPF